MENALDAFVRNILIYIINTGVRHGPWLGGRLLKEHSDIRVMWR
jgi:hypothetical protein